MSAIGRAVWFIESHFAKDISLDEIAEAAGLSRFHLSRVFGLVTGRSISAYIRARRLSDAAHALADGPANILSVALEAGYGSHEAFTRAFRDQFGVTPETVRKQGHVRNIELMEPLRMDDTRQIKIEPPRFEDSPPLLLAGLSETYAYGRTEGIPSLWQRFNRHFGNIPSQKGNVAYGVCNDSDADAGTFRYMAAAEVSAIDDLPGGFSTLKLPRQRYAVFLHRGHISAIAKVAHYVFGTWLPESGLQHAETPDLIERYDERFDPNSGTGVVEMWVPVKS
ncbi:AraC family transcriptional regulator [Ensifer sp.]|jgi:AraC family transcriptional regulator|uniref:AraC family transcriptional regulator n=1 Tax=Ensifer sp. TaxID=1872086 RepID=UPI002E12CA05|nr:AraC family transcriptional regulator [Ensifer sp.]